MKTCQWCGTPELFFYMDSCPICPPHYTQNSYMGALAVLAEAHKNPQRYSILFEIIIHLDTVSSGTLFGIDSEIFKEIANM